METEKNSMVAFEHSLRAGFGIETDIRDRDGELVISHDIPDRASIKLEDLLITYQTNDRRTTLALNIKADGLVPLLTKMLASYKIEDYFFFDMSVPETLRYKAGGLRYYTRESEHEPLPALYEGAAGVWMDCFVRDWIDEAAIRKHLDTGKDVCIVSPELHKRDRSGMWQMIQRSRLFQEDGLHLCTDHPEEARRFFGDR